ncbi:MAG TPA: hypothetical protein VNR64_01315, partial [Vicinamibacterales bacterium]|nr:hypothetical protein [Vicinamibacterales bacterium]
NEFSLAVMSNDTSSLAAAQPGGTGAVGTTGTSSATSTNIAEGSQVQLIGDAQTLTQLANRKVQVKGTIVPQPTSHSAKAAPAPAAAGPRVRVERVERLAESCQPGGTAGTSGVTPAPSPTTPPTEATPTPSPTPVPTEPPAAAPTPAPSSATRESGASAEALISGLNSAEVQQILGSVGPQNIASASDTFDASQVDALTQALQKDDAAMKKAQELTTALQGRGLLTPNERVVGISGTTIYKATQK